MDERPLVSGSSNPRRVVIVTAAGLWHWKFRGGRSADAFTALWGSIFDWLTGDATDARAAHPAAAWARSGESVRWRRGGVRDSVTTVVLRSTTTKRVDTLQLRFAGETGIADTPPLAPGVYETHTAGGDGLLAVNASAEWLPRRPMVRAGAVGSAPAADRAARAHALVDVRIGNHRAVRRAGAAPEGRPAMKYRATRGRVAAPRKSLWQRIKEVALTDVAVFARGGVDAGSLERLETLLIESDFGVRVSSRLVADMERMARRGDIETQDDFERALRAAVAAALRSGRSDPSLVFAGAGPTVILVLGVNGAGKTTFIGKLATRLKREGKRVVVAAGDTFRAGAVDQLRVWAERAGVDFVSGASGGDPAAVAFSAIDAGVTRGADVIIIDTAGRLHTSDDLMEELRKVVRVIAKRLPGAPHEALLVLDGTIGQNAIAQASTFAASVPVTGIVVTKLDGTSKGGVIVAVHEALDVPVKFVGVGEGAADLRPFDPAHSSPRRRALFDR